MSKLDWGLGELALDKDERDREMSVEEIRRAQNELSDRISIINTVISHYENKRFEDYVSKLKDLIEFKSDGSYITSLDVHIKTRNLLDNITEFFKEPEPQKEKELSKSLVSFNQFLVNNMAKTKQEDQAKLDSSPSSRLKYAKYVEQCGIIILAAIVFLPITLSVLPFMALKGKNFLPHFEKPIAEDRPSAIVYKKLMGIKTATEMLLPDTEHLEDKIDNPINWQQDKAIPRYLDRYLNNSTPNLLEANQAKQRAIKQELTEIVAGMSRKPSQVEDGNLEIAKPTTQTLR